MPVLAKKQLNAIAKNIKLLITDVDGVLTDGSIVLDGKDGEIKAFHVRDGHGIKMIQRIGVHVAFITGRQSKVVERRAKELGVSHVYQGCKDKLIAYSDLIGRLGVSHKETAFVGDDIVDIPLLVRVGLPIAVADAVDSAKAFAVFTTTCRGGRGALREVTDLIIKAKGRYDEVIEKYSKI